MQAPKNNNISSTIGVGGSARRCAFRAPLIALYFWFATTVAKSPERDMCRCKTRGYLRWKADTGGCKALAMVGGGLVVGWLVGWLDTNYCVVA